MHWIANRNGSRTRSRRRRPYKPEECEGMSERQKYLNTHHFLLLGTTIRLSDGAGETTNPSIKKNPRDDATKPLTCCSNQIQQYRHVSPKVPPKGSDHRSQTDRTMNQCFVTTAARDSTADPSSMASCHAHIVQARYQVRIHLLGMSSNAAVPAHGSTQHVPPTVP